MFLDKIPSLLRYIKNFQEHSLAPGNVLNVLTKGIVKKLGADSFSSQDSLDDSVKKVFSSIP